jgi:sugar lactone lactonase YvrE
MKKEVSPMMAVIGILVVLIAVQVVYWKLLGPTTPKEGLPQRPPPPGHAAVGESAPPPAGLPEVLVATAAGGAEAGYRDGPAGQARFDGPAAVAAASDGSIYVADSRNHAIRRISPQGMVSTIAGGPSANGFGGYADGRAREAKFSAPAGVAVLPDGSLLVADTGNHRLRRVAADGAVSTSAGADTPRDEMGRPSGGYKDGPASQAQFRFPVGLAVSGDGAIYVADAGNHRVRRLAGGVVSTVGTTGGKLDTPTGVAIDAGTLLVTDAGGHNLWRGPLSGPLTPVALAKSETPLAAPAGVVATGGAAYVTDTGSYGLYRVAGGTATLLAGQQGVSDTPEGTGDVARFAQPGGLTRAPNGALYIADFGSNRVLRVTLPGGGS